MTRARWSKGWAIAFAAVLGAQIGNAEEFYVSNADPGMLLRYDLVGVRTVVEDTGLTNPIGVAADASGNIYLVDWDSIFKFDAQGNRSVFANLPGEYPTGLAFGPNGDLYASVGPSSIYRFDKEGHGTLFATVNEADLGGMAFDRDGNLYAASSRASAIFRFEPGGAAVVAHSDVHRPACVVFDPQGNLFVSNPNIHTVTKITPTGVRSVFADASAGLNVPLGLAFDSSGALYVVNFFGNSIIKFDPEGRPSPFVTSGLSRPRYIALRPARLKPVVIERAAQGGYRLTVSGIPSQQYTLQFQTDLAAEEAWQTLDTGIADAQGNYSIIDNPPPSVTARYYRVVRP